MATTGDRDTTEPGTLLSRRRFLKLAAASASLMVLSACGQASAPLADQAATAAPAGGSAEPVTLTMWGNHPEWKDRVLAILAEFERENPSIKVAFDPKPGDTYQTALNTALAGGEAPDLIGLFPGPALDEAAKSGQILDLTGKVPLERLNSVAQAASKVGDKAYGVPIVGMYTVGLYYQTKLFSKYNLTPPSTWEELLETSRLLKEQGEVALIMPAKDGIVPYFFYTMACCSVFGPEGYEQLRKGALKLTDEGPLKAMELTRQLADYYQEGALSTSYVEGKALFAREQGAMMIGGSADYAGYLEVNPQAELGVVAFPAPAAGGFPATVSGMELVYGVNSQSKYQEQAIALLTYFMQDKAAQMVADTITLATVQGVASAKSPVMAQMVAAAQHDVRVWYEVPATAGVFDLFTSQSQQLFTDAVTPAQFAQTAQEAIKPEA